MIKISDTEDMEKRRLTIIELDSDYFKSAIERFRIYESQFTLF
jgi:hypothetical protein